jgi:predicted TIM-barrel fold metal-dependent hydrolase
LHEYADRIMPVAVIPMHTPQEALAELEYAVQQLGMRAIMMAGHVRRPIPAIADIAPQANRASGWFDTFGLDSAYDYDPVWAKCVELKVAPTFHSGGIGWGSRRSISNFMYNHIGHFAAAGEAVCKALFMGGVTRRFPTLRCAFLEGGVGWACNLYADLVGHWEKRNPQALENYNPANLNREQLADLYWRYGGKLASERFAQMARSFTPPGGPEDGVDDWAACHIERAEDIRDLFIPHFYFGCEADDPMNAWAFNTKVNPFGARLKAIFSSDIGHWDVPDMTEVVAEAHELVDKDVLSAEDFRDFVFTNPVTLWTAMNPDFFKGTVVEGEVQKLMAR